MDRQDNTSSVGSISEFSNGDSGSSSHVKIQVKSDDDSIEQPQTLQTGIFGVLFTLSKEKNDYSFKIAALKLAVDFIQLFTIVINPSLGWNIDPNGPYWTVNWINITPLVQPWGYNFFVALLYIMVALLIIASALCVWVAWCFKNKNFAHIWPIVIVRLFIGVFFQIFDVASLNLLQIGLTCQFWGPQPASQTNMLEAFPTYSCLAMPQLINMFVSAITLLFFVALVTLVNISDFEMNPLSKRPFAMAHSGVETKAFLIKFLMTLTTTFVGYVQPQSVLLLVFSTYLLWLHVRWVPFVMNIMNHARIGLYTAVWWTSVTFVILTFLPHYSSALTILMLAGLVPAMLVGIVISWLRLSLFSKIVFGRFRAAAPGTKARDIYNFEDPRDVEIVMRCCRVWVNVETLDEEAVRRVEEVVKAGLQLFPTNSFMIITYSNFLVEVQGAAQSGYSQVHAAKKANPSFMDKFAIFSREQQHLQSLSTEKSGQEAVDLISYVEFQRNQRRAINAHKEALLTIRFFWQELLKHKITFSALSKALHRIDKCILDAEKVYKVILEQYPNSARLIRLYAMFLEDVKNDPAKASKFYTEAEKLEGNVTENFNDGLDEEEESGQALTTVSKNSCVVVINSVGIIQMVNKNTCLAFGYHRTNDLKGKNVNILVPPPFAQRHDTYLRNYLTTGKEHIINRVSEWIALHREHYVFPCKLSVSKVSGAGEDSVFMGVLEPLSRKPNQANVWTLKGGSIVSVDQEFHDWFGYAPSDLVGKSIHDLIVDPSVLKQLFEPTQKPLSHQQSSVQEQLSQQVTGAVYDVHLLQLSCVMLRHKYTEPLDCSLKTTLGGVEHLKLLVFTFERNKLQPHTMVVGAKGHCEYITESLAQALGRKATEMQKLRVHISELMAQPYARFHFKEYMQDIDKKPPPWSCRSGAPVMLLSYNGKKKIPAKLTVKSSDESGDMQHMVQVELLDPAKMLDSKRLRLYVNRQGEVTEVLEGSVTVFGFDPRYLVGMSLAGCVDVLKGAEKEGRVRELLEIMAKRSQQCPGESYRVVVTPTVEEADLASFDGMADEALEEFSTYAVMTVTQSLAKKDDSYTKLNQIMAKKQEQKIAMKELPRNQECKPVEETEHLILDGPNAVAALAPAPVPEVRHDFEVQLWRSDMISAVLSVDAHGAIQKVDESAAHQPGLLFGVPGASLAGLKLNELIGWSASLDALLGKEGIKRGALKASMEGGPATGPVHALAAKHADGGDLQLAVQAATVEGVRKMTMVLLRIAEPATAPTGGVEAMCKGNVAPILNLAMRRSSTINLQMGSQGGLYLLDAGRFGSQALELGEGYVAEEKTFGSSAMLLEEEVERVREHKPAPRVPVARKAFPKADVSVTQSSKLTWDQARPGDLLIESTGKASREIEDGLEDVLPGTPTKNGKPAMQLRSLDHAIGSQSAKSSGHMSRASAWLEEEQETKGEDDYLLGTAYEGLPHDEAAPIPVEKMGTGEMSDAPSSEFDAAEDLQHQADFHRAKRYKRILALLGKTTASTWIRRLKRDSLLAVSLLIMANTVCFAVLLMNYSNMNNLITSIRLSGMLFVLVEQIKLNLRSLQQAYLGGSPNLYTIADVSYFSQQLLSLQQSYLSIEQTLYFTYSLTPDITNLWASANQITTLYINSAPNTIVATTNMSFWDTSNYYLDNVAELANYYSSYNTTIASSSPFLFIMTNGHTVLQPNDIELQVMMITAVSAQADQLAWIQLLLMGVNGILMNMLVASYMLWLLNQVAYQRYNLYSVFHAIPIGLTRSLASKKVDLQSDEEDEETQILGPMIEGEANDAQDKAAAETIITISTYNDPAAGEGQSLTSNGRRGLHKVDEGGANKILGWLRRFGSFLKPSTAANSTSKRKLVRNSHENLWLLTPFALWGIVLMTVYLVSYTQISGLSDNLGAILASSLAQGEIMRCAVMVQEVCSRPYGASTNTTLSSLASSIVQSQYLYALMMNGNYTNQPAYPGLTFAPLQLTPTMQDIFYGTDCLRTTSAPCVGPSNPYYSITHRGLDSLIRRVLAEAEIILWDEDSVLMLNNSALQFLYQITFADFADGMQSVRTEQVNQVDNSYILAQTLQIVAYVLMFTILFAFVFFMLFPFMARTRHESQRIAELLSQLPREVDVEKLVLSVLTQANEAASKKDEKAVSKQDSPIKKALSDKIEHLGEKPGKLVKTLSEPLKCQDHVPFVMPSVGGPDSRRSLGAKSSSRALDGSSKLGRESNKVLPING